MKGIPNTIPGILWQWCPKCKAQTLWDWFTWDPKDDTLRCLTCYHTQSARGAQSHDV